MARILVVDDEPVAVRALQTLLEMDGHDVAACGSGRDALAALAREPFDAVVTDLEMPGVRGEDVIRAATRGGARTPVLVVTAYGQSPAGAAALALGAHRVLDKPLDYDLLATELAAVLARG